MQKYKLEFGIHGYPACSSIALATDEKAEIDDFIKEALEPGFWARVFVWSDSLNTWEISG